MQHIEAQARLKRKQDTLAASVDADLVILDIARGSYFGVTGVGCRIWELMANPVTVEEIVQVLCQEYDVESAACLADVRAFTDQMLQLQVVELT